MVTGVAVQLVEVDLDPDDRFGLVQVHVYRQLDTFLLAGDEISGFAFAFISQSGALKDLIQVSRTGLPLSR